MQKKKYIKYRDEVSSIDIVAMEGFQWPSDLKARIFCQRVELYRSGPKELRYFPQIDDDVKESVVIIGNVDKGYRLISEAKSELEKHFNAYIANIDMQKYITCQ
jgi:hypothetical protein